MVPLTGRAGNWRKCSASANPPCSACWPKLGCPKAHSGVVAIYQTRGRVAERWRDPAPIFRAAKVRKFRPSFFAGEISERSGIRGRQLKCVRAGFDLSSSATRLPVRIRSPGDLFQVLDELLTSSDR